MNREANRDALGRALQPGPGCLPLERLDGPLSATDRAHIDECPRCQAEVALFESADAPDRPGERADISWVTEQLRDRRGATRPASSPAPMRTSWLSVSRLLPIAATLAFAALIGYSMWDPEPRLGSAGGPQVYRTARIEGARPSGDLSSAPGTFEWSAFAGAVRYDVVVSEVDGTPLWRGTSDAPRIDLPSSLQARFIPGKTILWQVTATNASGATLAESGPQQVRVPVRKP